MTEQPMKTNTVSTVPGTDWQPKREVIKPNRHERRKAKKLSKIQSKVG